MVKQLSKGERDMQRHVANVDEDSNLGPETPEERQARFARNWEEIKKARINALKSGNLPGVKMLDDELRSGRGTDFPADAKFDGADEDDGLGPVSKGVDVADDGLGPRVSPRASRPQAPKPASQGVVRQSEPSMALIEQEADERGWENARRDYIKQHGVLTPGKTQSQAITEATGRRDPAETRQDAEAQHAIETGELIYGDSAIYNIAKPLASIGGFAKGGPLGATAAETLVRATALGYNIDKALDKGMDKQQAADIVTNELFKGMGVDALWNFGTPLIGQLIGKIPGLNRIGEQLHAALEKRLGGKPKPSLRDTRIEALKQMTDDPARAEAVEQLSRRVEGDYIPTRGQIDGNAGFRERRTYEAFPGEFQKQAEAFTKTAEKMRQGTVSPNSQPTAQHLGEQIDRLANETVKKTKDRLRPVFQEANNMNIVADFNTVGRIAKEALEADSRIIGKGKLTAAERAHLQQIIDDVKYQPWAEAEHAMDFVSIQKSMLRKLNPDGKPTPFFSKIVGDLMKAGDDALEQGALRMGKGNIVEKLRSARADYRVMNEVAYDGAIKEALRKGDHAPEAIGPYLWQNGMVTRLDELDELIKLASKEGVASKEALAKMRRNVTRGFLADGVRDVKSAATFTESMSDPKRKATWEVLTSGPGGQELKHAMSVLENAAQIASLPEAKRQSTFMQLPLSRAVGSGLGISWVTAGANIPLAGLGLTIAGAMKLLSTAYVHGDVGTINLISKVLRANSATTAASAKALQTLVPQLEQAAEKYKVADLFIPKEDSQQSEQPAQ